MEIEIIRKPFLFMEALEALYKHINGISFAEMRSNGNEPAATPAELRVYKMLDTLQEILDEACQDVDSSDPLMQKFFQRVETNNIGESTCLARVLVSAFVDYRSPDFDDTVGDILAEWNKMNETGGILERARGLGLQYACHPSQHMDLFSQIYALDLPAEFRLRLYGEMHRFPESLEELANLMRPIAVKMEKAIEAAGIDLQGIGEYWKNSPIPPLEFLANSLGKDAVAGAGDHLRLVIGLMTANKIFYAMEHEPGRYRPYNYMNIGCCISAKSLLQEHSIALDEASATLRGLSERKRLEALHRLAKSRRYGQELAEELGMDRGNLSRLLTVLHNQGFLKQERENQRIYYQSDREAVQNFFNNLVSLIFD